jgi:hypothetical protein
MISFPSLLWPLVALCVWLCRDYTSVSYLPFPLLVGQVNPEAIFLRPRPHLGIAGVPRAELGYTHDTSYQSMFPGYLTNPLDLTSFPFSSQQRARSRSSPLRPPVLDLLVF